MEANDLEQLKELRQQMRQAKQQLDMTAIQRKLTRYSDFILNFKKKLGTVVSVEDFRAFRVQWRECGSLASLPRELADFHAYLSLAEKYNSLVIRGISAGEDIEFMRTNPPMLVSETEVNILEQSAILYDRPFNWEKLRARLVGAATRKAVFTHLVACANPSEVLALLDEGAIKKETILDLPYQVSVANVYGNGTNEKELYEAYHDNLATLYDHFGMTLPPLVTFHDEPLKGITFEGRTEKLRYLLSHIGAMSDSDSISYNRQVLLRAESYTFTPQEGEAEPAIRVIATIPGDRNFQAVDIGNLDRNLAISLAKDHPSGLISVSFEDVDYFERAGADGTVHQPYAKLCVQVADQPYEKERQQNRSQEVDELFEMEVLK